MRHYSKPIGGYFELEAARECDAALPHSPAIYTQSARAGLALVLCHTSIRRLWLPRYVCGAIPKTVEKLGVEVAWYNLDKHLMPVVPPELSADEGLFIVNYFGLCDARLRTLAQAARERLVIVDQAQALFAAPVDNTFTLYSPRKFVGVPDGGFLVSHQPLTPCLQVTKASVKRSEHLLMRANDQLKEGYKAFRQAEATLENEAPAAMSPLTTRLLKQIDYAQVKARRSENYEVLKDTLNSTNELEIFKAPIPEGPLCYPWMPKAQLDRTWLAERGVFIPCYWEEVLKQPGIGSLEEDLVRRCLPLPCDQRYDVDDMKHLISMVQECPTF